MGGGLLRLLGSCNLISSNQDVVLHWKYMYPSTKTIFLLESVASWYLEESKSCGWSISEGVLTSKLLYYR